MTATVLPETIYPDGFAERCLQAIRELGDPRLFEQWLVDMRSRFDQEVASVRPSVYAVPLSIARHLFRHRTPSGRKELMAAVENLPDERLAQGIAAAARDAWLARDWWMVGWLCLRTDTAVARLDEQRERHPLQQLCAQFERLLDRVYRQKRDRIWKELACGYFAHVPAFFLPPIDLCVAGAPSPRAGVWRVLRRLMDVAPLWWQGSADLRGVLERAGCPFLRSLASRCEPPPGGLTTGIHGSVLDDGMEEGADVFDDFLDEQDNPWQHERPAAPAQPATPPQPSPPKSRLARLAERKWALLIGAVACGAGLAACLIWLFLTR